MNTITIFGITLNVNPVAFTIAGWSVYWYGIIIAVGVFTALFYAMKNGNRFGIDPNRIFDSFIIVLPCAILGARAYYIIFSDSMTFKDFFNFSGGHGFAGLAIYGGIIAAAISIFVMQRVYKFSILAALDITAVGFLIGQGIGRWGNFINQEAYGTPTGSDWFGMTGNVIKAETFSDALVHPCFLYESLWCILGAFLLHYFSKKRKFKGQIALMYGVWYGFERTFVEMLRTDSLMLGSLRVSSLLSAIICITCGVTLVIILKRKSSDNGVYLSQFNVEKNTPILDDAEPEPLENSEEVLEKESEENADN